MKAMVKKAAHADVVAKYGRPFDTLGMGMEFRSYRRNNPGSLVTKGCVLDRGNGLTYNKSWFVYQLRFARDNNLLLKADWDFGGRKGLEPVGEMPLTGLTARDCQKHKECSKRLKDACSRTMELNTPSGNQAAKGRFD